MEPSAATNRLLAILQDLKEAIRMADFARMEEISAELETILRGIQVIEPDRAGQLRRLVRETEICLAAAAEGLRSGRRRLHEIGAARRGETYDHQGQRQGLPSNNSLGASSFGRV